MSKKVISEESKEFGLKLLDYLRTKEAELPEVPTDESLQDEVAAILTEVHLVITEEDFGTDFVSGRKLEVLKMYYKFRESNRVKKPYDPDDMFAQRTREVMNIGNRRPPKTEVGGHYWSQSDGRTDAQAKQWHGVDIDARHAPKPDVPSV